MTSRSMKSMRGPAGYLPPATAAAPTGFKPQTTSLLPTALPNTQQPLGNTLQPLQGIQQPRFSQTRNLRPARPFGRG